MLGFWEYKIQILGRLAMLTCTFCGLWDLFVYYITSCAVYVYTMFVYYITSCAVYVYTMFVYYITSCAVYVYTMFVYYITSCAVYVYTMHQIGFLVSFSFCMDFIYANCVWYRKFA